MQLSKEQYNKLPERLQKHFSTGNFHATVKPQSLCEYLVKLVSKEGAVVLDPFAGSGSTLIACKKLKRNYIGCELDPEYIKIAEARLSAVNNEQC